MELILTNRKTFTEMEVVDLYSEYVKPENVEILVNHLSYPELATYIVAFAEIDGLIHFDLGEGELIKVTKKS